jgi:hypothetical protein
VAGELLRKTVGRPLELWGRGLKDVTLSRFRIPV